MKPRLHLLAMPWTKPNYPSIQIASLQAYIDETLGQTVRTYAYSAYLPVYFKAFGADLLKKFSNYHDCGELAYLFIHARNFTETTLS